jgi:DNA-binding beta-propeller fold protein YncE
MSRASVLRTCIVATVVLVGAGRAAGQNFLNFESGHVRPLALSPDGDHLLAVNTPDNRLAIFDVTPGGLTLAAEVPVGLEPVAVTARTNQAGRTEAWVVNHLSDSVSIVELDPSNIARSRVTRTLLVGDEPRDVVFAGASGNRAFVTCAHRGQNRPGDPQLTTSGVGRADVWTFDANALGAALGGTPLSIVQLFADTPRALAVSADGATVYAAAFHSGNRTTTLLELSVRANDFGLVRPPPPPGATPNEPDVGVIVRFNPANNRWEDGETNQDWSPMVKWSIPDRDVFLINANASPPALVSTNANLNSVVGVGTVIFNMAVRPTNGKIYVANTDARNIVRFEPEVRGHIAESRITVISGTSPAARHLNPHIDYGTVPGPQSEIDQSLAFPMDMTFSADGNTLFVVGFGSARLGVFDADDLEAGIITKSLLQVGKGPSGVVLDAGSNRLYVMNRIDGTISVVSNASSPSRSVTGTVGLGFDPSPAVVRAGRNFLYDARKSGHGDNACASCHIFGDFDSLAWDLGDPFGSVVTNFNVFRAGGAGTKIFHPMKGPMTTQSLRGMADAGPMHWRGDRTGATFQNDPAFQNEDLAFKAFNPAFVGLLGADSQLSAADMQAFTDFILTVRYPPNPIRALTNVPTSAQSTGETIFNTMNLDAGSTCQNCHRLPLGADGQSSVEGETQEFKIAHLRNLYQKVGMFGLPPSVLLPNGINGGNVVRGTGFLHDGAVSTVFLFLNAPVFAFQNNTQRQQVEQFVLAFDTGLRPIVGQQVSATPATFNDTNVVGRIDLLIARDDAGDCDLTVKGIIANEARGAVYAGSNLFRTDRASEALLDKTALRTLAGTQGQELTYTCVPPGSGQRIGIDRDGDGVSDRTELDAGTNPADPGSFPGATTTTSTTTTTTTSTSTTMPPAVIVPISTRALNLKDDVTPPLNAATRKVSFKSSTKSDAPANRIVVPPLGSGGDPTLHGATLTVYNSDPATAAADVTTVVLPAAGWSVYGSSGYRFRNTAVPGVPVSKATVRADSVVLKGGREAWTYTLDEPVQGRVAVRLRLGTGATWCAEAPAKASSSGNNDRPGRFVGQSNSPAPATCPAVP